MSEIKLLLDEDVWAGLTIALRDEGFDVIHVSEVGRTGLSDPEQLAYATQESRALLTHNAKDFVPLAIAYFFGNQTHYGIIVTPQFKKGVLVNLTTTLLKTLSADEIRNTVRYLSDYRQE